MMASQTTLSKKFVELREAKQTHRSLRPKIQKVAEYLRNRSDFEKEFSPKSVSIGPIHHNDKNLRLGENYKLTCAASYIPYTQQTSEFLHKKIADKINELKELFADDVLALANTAESLKGFSSLEEKLSWLLFVDGCFLLHIMLTLNFDEFAKVDLKLVNIMVDKLDDLDFELVNIKMDQLALVMKDVLLLENQLPFLVLKLLWKNDNENELIDTMKSFLKCYHQPTLDDKTTGRRPGRRTDIQQKLPNEPPTHLLDLHRKIILTKSNRKMKVPTEMHSIENLAMPYRNIQDLRALGIQLKSSGTRNPRDIDFSEGWFTAELTLPKIIVDNATAASFLNLIAYEMCPDFKSDYGICSFLVFMDSLIDHAEDVKILRSKGILGNSLGRDEEVADLFNNICRDLICNPFIYSEVSAKIHEHRFKKCKIWLAQAYYTYFSNPWAITGFLAAFMALALTFIQTWFSIFPRSS